MDMCSICGKPILLVFGTPHPKASVTHMACSLEANGQTHDDYYQEALKKREEQVLTSR